MKLRAHIPFVPFSTPLVASEIFFVNYNLMVNIGTLIEKIKGKLLGQCIKKLLNSSPFQWECLLDSDYNRFIYCKDNDDRNQAWAKKTRGKEYQLRLKIENN